MFYLPITKGREMEITLRYKGSSDIMELRNYCDAVSKIRSGCDQVTAHGHIVGRGSVATGVYLTFQGDSEGLKRAVGICLDDIGYPVEPPLFRKERRLFDETLAERGVKPVRFAGHWVYLGAKKRSR